MVTFLDLVYFFPLVDVGRIEFERSTKDDLCAAVAGCHDLILAHIAGCEFLAGCACDVAAYQSCRRICAETSQVDGVPEEHVRAGMSVIIADVLCHLGRKAKACQLNGRTLILQHFGSSRNTNGGGCADNFQVRIVLQKSLCLVCGFLGPSSP